MKAVVFGQFHRLIIRQIRSAFHFRRYPKPVPAIAAILFAASLSHLVGIFDELVIAIYFAKPNNSRPDLESGDKLQPGIF